MYSARVERVSGSDINYLNYEQTLVENIEFGTILSLNQFIGFSTGPISFTNGEDVTISISFHNLQWLLWTHQFKNRYQN